MPQITRNDGSLELYLYNPSPFELTEGINFYQNEGYKFEVDCAVFDPPPEQRLAVDCYKESIVEFLDEVEEEARRLLAKYGRGVVS